MIALYAQEAIGNCFEQEGNYSEGIQAYREESLPNNTTASSSYSRVCASECEI